MNDVSLTTPVDLDACAAEPIRIPGAIQPHGALMVIAPQTLDLLHASANLQVLTGVDFTSGPLGSSKGSEDLAVEVKRWLSQGQSVFLRTIKVGGRELHVQGHVTDQGVILEFEEPPSADGQTLEALYPRLRRFLEEIAAAGDIRAMADIAVQEVRALTGFNRTMLYAFDEKGDGTVLAEDSDGVLPSYKGQRFPASDIPAQARELYRLNRLRLIVTSDYTPCPVEPALSPVDGKPLDLSHAALRSVSPVHLEYMRNMGTGSSMSVSILVEGRLWALISGHSAEAKHVSPQVRTACDMLGQILSLQIEARERANRTAERLELKQVETELLARLATAPSFQGGLADNGDLWMGLTHASGAAAIVDGEVISVGLTPSHLEIQQIAAMLQTRRDDLVTVESMTELWPHAEAFAEVASGLLAVSVSQIHADYVMWFRPEVVRTIDWSGDPSKPMAPGPDRLHPRKSFELWREQVRLRALPWSAVEVDSARGFRNAIQDVVLKRAEERAELTGRLERINKELEAFSYSISHDLRAPFRHIVGYAELLSEREQTLDQKSRHYLQSITEAALSAGRLVDDLLHFSQMGRASLHMGRVDVNKLVSEIRRSLEPDTDGRRIEWRISPLPQAWADNAMLRQALLNLIQNAVKYTRPRKVAEITIEGEDRGDFVAYTVKDNGVGFDMTYVGKLFGVFQRLHRAEEFEGTGIGLALTKRIADRHGGAISARSVLGEGASFTLTLPKREVVAKGAN